ncbi:MAG: T9SS type A sorting domain-containing protein [Ignavibacteriae bacterium]|nr:T9SS type A sorting domain-containing protein [Ignavibacteriota bacterium]
MNNNLQSYFDTAKGIKNHEPLLSKDEIFSLVENVSPVPEPKRSHKKIAFLTLAAIVAISGAVTAVKYTYPPVQKETQVTSEHITANSRSIQHNEQISSLSEKAKPTVESPVQPEKQQVHQALSQTQTEKHVIHQSVSQNQPEKSSVYQSIAENSAVSIKIPEQSINVPHRKTVAKDIEGLKVIELSEDEAMVLAAYYPKLYVWLHKNFSATDTCDITLTPTSASHENSVSELHSVVFLKIRRENTVQNPNDEFILWFTPTVEFADALPERYKAPFRSELKARTDVVANCLPAERACKAMKGSSPFFDLCRRESGALSAVNISPNPASESAECTFALENPRDVYISLHEVSGRFVKTMIHNEHKTSGEQKVPLLLQSIPAGAYLVAISTSKGEQAVIQLIIQK